MYDLRKQIFRRGIALARSVDGRWQLVADEAFPDIATLARTCGERPIAIERENLDPHVFLMTPTGSHFGVETTGLLQRFSDPHAVPYFFQWKEVVYLLNAAGYHCTNMATAYARIREDFLRVIRGAGAPEDDHASFQGASDDVWYELDALLSAARRMLEVSRFVLWKAYGDDRPCPRNFEDTLKRATNMPGDVRTRLESHWSKYAAPLSEYRDCIHHSASLTQFFGDVRLEKREHGVYLVSAVIPDNPGTKSQRKFTYDRKLDALDYAYEVTMEWHAVARFIAAHLAPHPAFDAG